MVHNASCPVATNGTERALRKGKSPVRAIPRACRAIKNVRKQGQLGTQPGAVGTSHQQTHARSDACVRVHGHGASRARDSGRPVTRRLVATVSFSASQPRQPSYTFIFTSGDYAKKFNLAAQESDTYRSSSRRSSSDSSGMVLLKIAPRSNRPLARL